MNENQIPIWEQLTAYFDGELDREQRLEMEQKLFENPEYAQALKEWKELRSEMQVLPLQNLTSNRAESEMRSQAVMESIFQSIAAGDVDWDSKPIDLDQHYKLRTASEPKNVSAQWTSDFRRLHPAQRMKRWRWQLTGIASVAALLVLSLFLKPLSEEFPMTGLRPDSHSDSAVSEADSLGPSLGQPIPAGSAPLANEDGEMLIAKGNSGSTNFTSKSANPAGGLNAPLSVSSDAVVSTSGPEIFNSAKSNSVLAKENSISPELNQSANLAMKKSASSLGQSEDSFLQQSLADSFAEDFPKTEDPLVLDQQFAEESMLDTVPSPTGIMPRQAPQSVDRIANGSGIQSQARVQSKAQASRSLIIEGKTRDNSYSSVAPETQVAQNNSEVSKGIVIFDIGEPQKSLVELNEVLKANGFGRDAIVVQQQNNSNLDPANDIDPVVAGLVPEDQNELPAVVLTGDIERVASTINQFRDRGNTISFLSRLPNSQRNLADIQNSQQIAEPTFSPVLAQADVLRNFATKDTTQQQNPSALVATSEIQELFAQERRVETSDPRKPFRDIQETTPNRSAAKSKLDAVNPMGIGGREGTRQPFQGGARSIDFEPQQAETTDDTAASSPNAAQRQTSAEGQISQPTVQVIILLRHRESK